MATPSRFQTRRSTTAGNVPSSLLAGELAVNIPDKRLFMGDASGNVVDLLGQLLPKAGGTSTGEQVFAASGSGVRFTNGTYGISHFTDGAAYYVLLTASGSPLSNSYTAVRPFFINLSSGLVSMAAGVAVTGGLSADTLNLSSVGPGALYAGTGTTYTAAQPGINRTGSADTLSAVNATITAAAGGLVGFSPGTYSLSANAATPSNQGIEFRNARFNGSGNVQGLPDASPLVAGLTAGWTLAKDNYAGNRFTTFTSLTIASTGATANYEKAAGYDYAATSDPSSYGSSPVNKDCVGRQMTGAILSGNMTGRAWGFACFGMVQSGADGFSCAGELDSLNNGAAQPLLDQPNSKLGLQLVAMGSANSTVASVVETDGGGALWQDGYVVKGSAVAGFAFRILAPNSLTANTFAVTPDGTLSALKAFINSLTVTGAANSVVMAGNDTAGGRALATSSSGPLWFTAAGSDITYLGSLTSPIVNLGLQARNVMAGITAAGTTSATATPLTRNINEVSFGPAGSGVRLPAGPVGAELVVLNRSGVSINLWPHSGGTIEATGTDTAVAIPNGGNARCTLTGAAQWRT